VTKIAKNSGKKWPKTVVALAKKWPKIVIAISGKYKVQNYLSLNNAQ
jgi:hypothetical protein